MLIEILKVIFYLLVIMGVLWCAYYFTKKLSVYSMNLGTSKYIKVVDKLNFSKEMGLAIIQVGDKYMLISLTGNGMSVLREFAEKELLEFRQNENMWQNNSYIRSVTDQVVDKTASLVKNCHSYIKSKKIENNSDKKNMSFAEMLNLKMPSDKSDKKNSSIDSLLNDVSLRTLKLQEKTIEDRDIDADEN